MSQLENFMIPADLRFTIKESKTPDEYVDLVREWKKLWNLKVAVIVKTLKQIP